MARQLVLAATIVAVLAGVPADAARLITGKQIKDKSIKAVDLGAGSVTVSKIHSSTWSAIEDDLPEGPVGPAGPVGPTGIASIVTGKAHAVLCPGQTSCAIGSATALCPVGTKPVSGGGAAVATNGLFINYATGTGGQANGWTAAGDNFGSASEGYVDAYVYCSSGVSSFALAPGQQRSSAQQLATHR